MSTDNLAPRIFNASTSAAPGDIIPLQGANFDTSVQVRLAARNLSNPVTLEVMNRVGTYQMAVKIPTNVSGGMILWILNSRGASNAVQLNRAMPTHLDTVTLVPGGKFRVLGKNLKQSGFTPLVMVNGYPASLNLSISSDPTVEASNDNVLLATAPAQLTPTATATITVDNGNGTGSVQLDRTVNVIAGSGDPLQLGTGWGAGFTFGGRILTVTTPCDGTQNDAPQIQAAIDTAANSGGGVILLPSKTTCRIDSTLTMRSKVVLQGGGRTATVLSYRRNYPISASGADLLGLKDLTILNAGPTPTSEQDAAMLEGVIWNGNTRSFFKNVRFESKVSKQLFFTRNQNMVVMDSQFIHAIPPVRAGESMRTPLGPDYYLFNSSSGLIFTRNYTESAEKSADFSAVHDSLIFNNDFVRGTEGEYLYYGMTHRLVLHNTYRLSVLKNTFRLRDGQVLKNKMQNAGETLLCESPGSENSALGMVSSSQSRTLIPASSINLPTGAPENYGIAIVDGKGMGQTRRVMPGSTANQILVDRDWEVIPDSSSRYSTFFWCMEKSQMNHNLLKDNPRGIWLYQASFRDVDIVGNTILNGGGIYLRSFQSVVGKKFDSITNIRIADNVNTNTNREWMSYVSIHHITVDAVQLGTPITGVEVRNNQLTANASNLTLSGEEYTGIAESFLNMMRIEIFNGQPLYGRSLVLGTIFQSNQCVNCNSAYTLGTGADGTVLFQNSSPASGASNFLKEMKTLYNQTDNGGASTRTVIQ